MNSDSQPSQLALLGGAPSAVPPVPPYPIVSKLARARIDELLATGRLIGVSKRFEPIIAEAEDALAEYHGVRHALGTSSGHGALHASLIGLEITGGDEVITAPYTWGASISPILHNNSVPVFADVDPFTGLLDPESIESRITPRTRGILVVHIYGQPANMTAIRAIANRHSLAVIEDGSQAHGARHDGVRVGSFGDAAGFSCMGAKLLATTESGYMLTNDDRVYQKASLGTQHMGSSVNDLGRAGESGFSSDLSPFMDSLTYTYRLSTINAVLLVEQLKKLDQEGNGRRINAEALWAELDGVKSLRIPRYPKSDSLGHYALTFDFDGDHAGVSRDTYLEALQAEGVDALTYIPRPINEWRRLQRGSGAPRSMWDQMIQSREGEYADDVLPGAVHKAANSIEIEWQRRYIPDLEASKQVAAAIQKVEEHLPALRAFERQRGDNRT